MPPLYFDRDLSWLSFNERVLLEAGRPAVPLMERFNFLSIFSSNLDEFYRVRIPSLMALHKLGKSQHHSEAATTLLAASRQIELQQRRFGAILTEELIPALSLHQIKLVYGDSIPEHIQPACSDYFFSDLLTFLRPVDLFQKGFFPENNHLYFAVELLSGEGRELTVVNIPSQQLSRFFSAHSGNVQYIVFIDDIIREHLHVLFPGKTISSALSFKITRDAALELQDEYGEDIAEKIEKQLAKRDLGIATRILYDPGISPGLLDGLVQKLNLSGANLVAGGRYHHLRDLAVLPLQHPQFRYLPWPSVHKKLLSRHSLFNSIALGDIMIHTPYFDFRLVLRFFNESAIDPEVEEIYVTLYRIAAESRIATALINAARNGKSVTVFVELKARFDEANNIRWSKRMKEAGVRIVYSIPGLKVHAKIALVKRRKDNRTRYAGLLATGNFNETTARFYTDHILFTANKGILRELELLFLLLAKRKRPDPEQVSFKHLLVAQFNLQQRFLALIEREIEHARQGLPAEIIIKLNNLEETLLIDRLNEAAESGVKVQLLVRSICRLVPGQTGQNPAITVTRIVDRYLEHGRIFWFHNQGQSELFAGSADWMNRNIYRRIEVCFPITDPGIKDEMLRLLQFQLKDNTQAVRLDQNLQNIPINSGEQKIRSQEAIYQFICSHD